MTIAEQEEDFIEYLALVDNVHDFLKERCNSNQVKKRIKKLMDIANRNTDIDDDIKLGLNREKTNYTITEKTFFSKVEDEVLENYGITIGQTTTANQLKIFKDIFGITSSTKYYTNHDAQMSIKPKWPKTSKNHIVLKTPQNNFDSATSGGSSGSLGSSKVEIVYPLNTVEEWRFESNMLSRNENYILDIFYDDTNVTQPKNVLLSIFKNLKSRKGYFQIFDENNREVVIEIPFSAGGPIEYIKNKINEMVKLKKGILENGISVSALCESLTKKPKNLKTVGDKIQKALYELRKNKELDNDDLYDIILDIKRGGDWEQVLSTKWYQNQRGNKNKKVIFITGDYLCFLYAILNDINAAFISSSQMMTYNKDTQRGGAPKRPREEDDMEDGPIAKKIKEEGEIDEPMETDEQEIMEKPDIVDGFTELISNIRDLTMRWHSDTVSGKLDEDYEGLIVKLINLFKDEIKTNTYSGMDTTIANVKAVVSDISDVLLNKETTQENIGGVEESKTGIDVRQSMPQKNKKVYLMCISILFEIQSSVFDDNYDTPSEDEKFTDINTKPALPHIIESFYYSIITDKLYEKTNELELSNNDSARIIKQLLNNLYDSLVLSLEGGEERTSNIFDNGGFDTTKSKEIKLSNFFTSYKDILRKEEEKKKNGNPELVDKLNSSKESYVESAKLFIDNDIKYQPPIQKDDYSMDVEISEGKQQEGKQPEPSTSIKAPKLKQQEKTFGEKMEIDHDMKSLDKIKKQLSTSEGKVYEGKVSSKAPLKTFSDSNSNTPLSQQSVVSVTGGKKKRNPRKNNKTKKRTKKLKKTKKKVHKNKKKHNKKTKKMKKKRNNKTKAKKHNKHNKSKSKKHNKKQLFEMTIKELKEHVKNKNKNKNK
jgi:hypothetical protein